MIGALPTAATPAPPLAALLGDGAPTDGAPADSTQAEAFAAMLAQLGLSPEASGEKPATTLLPDLKKTVTDIPPVTPTALAAVAPSADAAVTVEDIDADPVDPDSDEDTPKNTKSLDPFPSPDALSKALGAGIGAVLALVTGDRSTPRPVAGTEPAQDISRLAAIPSTPARTSITPQSADLPDNAASASDAVARSPADGNVDQSAAKPVASQPKDMAKLLQMLVDAQKVKADTPADLPPPTAMTTPPPQSHGNASPSPATVASPSTDDPSSAVPTTLAAVTPAPAPGASLLLPPAAPAPALTLATAAAVPIADAAQQSMQHHLDLAHDVVWLDSLARDISLAASNTSQLRFQLNPEHLGSLHVELSNGSDGTAIRMIADTDAARAILLEAQPRLIAEARAQGLRISESQVDLGNQQQPGQNQSGQSSLNNAPGQQSQTAWNGGGLAGQGQNSRPHSEDRKPFAAMQQSRNERDAEPAPSSDERYA